jgi:hypothetical protein
MEHWLEAVVKDPEILFAESHTFCTSRIDSSHFVEHIEG